jgi:hypothetical protein
MKRQISNFVLTLGLSAVLGHSLAIAASRRTAVVQIPFGFQVQDTTLPAGSYSITEGRSAGVLQITNKETNESHSLRTSVPVSGPKGLRLVFHRYADHYYLSQIWVDDSIGRTLNQGRDEKEMVALKGLVEMSDLSIRLTRTDELHPQ